MDFSPNCKKKTHVWVQSITIINAMLSHAKLVWAQTHNDRVESFRGLKQHQLKFSCILQWFKNRWVLWSIKFLLCLYWVAGIIFRVLFTEDLEGDKPWWTYLTSWGVVLLLIYLSGSLLLVTYGICCQSNISNGPDEFELSTISTTTNTNRIRREQHQRTIEQYGMILTFWFTASTNTQILAALLPLIVSCNLHVKSIVMLVLKNIKKVI